MCRVQYSGSVACASVIQVPVTLLTMGMDGGRSRTEAVSARNGPAAGSSFGVWKACVVGRRRATMPAAARRDSASAIASSGPATTQSPGAFTVATAAPAGRCGATPSGSRETASIAPPGSGWIAFARPATSASASSSERMPAMQAAAYSPSEWPITASGTIPQLIHSFASA